MPEPTALSVATVDASGAANVRTVLMRFFDERGPGFVTNLESDKRRRDRGQPARRRSPDLAVALPGDPLPGHGAASSGATRSSATSTPGPTASRLSAWASDQSRPAPGREALEAKWAEALARFPDRGYDDDVPVPDFWGGWRIECDEVEFWAGRRNRLHDRHRLHPHR